MDIDASVENISKDTAEIIEVEELKELLKKDEKKSICGI